MNAPASTAHFFRHQYGKLVSQLVCRVGAMYLDEVEDAVQSALLKGLENWHSSPPENPSAWLYKVAFHQLLDVLRNNKTRQTLLERQAKETEQYAEMSMSAHLSDDCPDETLRMFFACCAPDIPAPSRLVIALKILSGFNVSEISQRLFTSPESVYKRLQRGQKQLKQDKYFLDAERKPDFYNRIGSVSHILYLLFTEGYLSVTGEHNIRLDLCQEALRLTHLLAKHPSGQLPEIYALLAMMYFHLARMESRLDQDNQLILLEDQQRHHWDKQKIYQGMIWLQRAAAGKQFSRYHGEAAIAAEHCLAKDYPSTRWDRIAELYEMLNQVSPSPVYVLNQAIALAENKGPAFALQALRQTDMPDWFQATYMWDAVLADLYLRTGSVDLARQHKIQALQNAPTSAIYALLEARFNHLVNASKEVGN